MFDPSRKSRFEELLKKKSFSQTTLFRRILIALKYSDPIDLAEKNKANFGKMITGERPFKEEYIPYLERFLETTYDYIVNGEGKSNDFRNKGIRYAAFTDNMQDYEELSIKTNFDTVPLFEFDEFGETVLDYILEYKSRNGLSYLIENSHVSLFSDGVNLQGTNAIGHNKKGIDVLNLIFEFDDAVLFEKFTDIWNRYEGSSSSLGILKKKDIIKKVISSKNIFKSMLKEKELDLNTHRKETDEEAAKDLYCNPLLYAITNYILLHENKYPNEIRKLLNFGIDHNIKVIKAIEENHKEVNNLVLDEKGYIRSGASIYGSLLFYKLNEQPDLMDSTSQLLSKLNWTINDLQFKSTHFNNGYSKSPVRLENGQIIKKTTDNEIEYRFFNDMEGEKFVFLPKLLEQKDGLDHFSYLEGQSESMVYEQSIKRIDGITEMIKILNDASKEILGDGKVYVHNDLSPMNVIFEGDEVKGIIDWDDVTIGHEYEDLIYIMWIWLNIGSWTRDNEHIFEGVKHILDVYGADKELKKNWADKMMKVMEARLAKTDKSESNYPRIFTWVRQSEIWVELYRDRITKEIG